MKSLMTTLNKIKAECNPGGEEEMKEVEKTDPFTALKRKIARDIKELRRELKLRDELLAKVKDPEDTTAVEASARARNRLAKVKAAAKELEDMHHAMKEKITKKKKGKLTQEEQEEIDVRAQTVELTWKHVAEVTELEQRRYVRETPASSAARSSLLAREGRASSRASSRASRSTSAAAASGSDSGGEGSASGTARVQGGGSKLPVNPEETSLPDIDVEQAKALIEEKQQNIDADLEDISKGVSRLKKQAQDMNMELKTQDVLLKEMDTKVEDANETLDDLNKRLLKLVKKIKRGDNMFCIIFMLIILLGILGYFYSVLFG